MKWTSNDDAPDLIKKSYDSERPLSKPLPEPASDGSQKPAQPPAQGNDNDKG